MRLKPLIYRFASSRLGALLFAPTLHLVDRLVFRVSNGRAFATSALAGLPIVMLTSTGAKSGARRTVPLVGIRDGDKVVSSHRTMEARATRRGITTCTPHPEATLSINGQSRNYIARAATPSEYDHYWGQAVSLYVGYAAYKSRTGGRNIPIMVLTPKSE